MLELVVTAKIQILTKDAIALEKTMERYSAACNEVSKFCFKTHNLKQPEVHKHLYATLREKYELKSQMACSVVKTVIARYKSIQSNNPKKWTKVCFKCPQLDLVWNRDYSLVGNHFSVNTLEGRKKCEYHSKGMEKYFDKSKYEFGTAKLVKKLGKFYLHVPVTTQVEDCKTNEIMNVVGIDRGINFIAVSYGSNGKAKFFNGRRAKHKRAKYKELRRQLQKRRTPSARRRLKRIGQRENRWMRDVNHCVSKALVSCNPAKTLFVLEDLSNVRQVTERVRKKDRYVAVSWAFYDLEQKLKCKAKRNGGMVINVDPRHTSQRCPKCGHMEPANRDKKKHRFCCKNCGYQSNDDRIGAMNLYLSGLEKIKETTECVEGKPLDVGAKSTSPNATIRKETLRKDAGDFQKSSEPLISRKPTASCRG